MDELKKDFLSECAAPFEPARALRACALLGLSESRTIANVLRDLRAIKGACGLVSDPHDVRRDARPMAGALPNGSALAQILDLAAIFDFPRCGEVVSLQSTGITRRFI